MNPILKCFSILSVLSVCLKTNISSARGGMDTGGGFSARIEGENGLYLYDFLEGGIDDVAEINTNLEDTIGARERLKKVFPSRAGEEVLSGVVSKLNEISQKNEVYAEVLLQYTEKYLWNILRAGLIPLRDIGSTPIKLGDGVEVELTALRDDNKKIVYIKKELWEELPLVHKVGLIFHEVNYALIKEISGVTDSSNPRALTAFIFDPRFSDQTPEMLKTFLIRMGFSQNFFLFNSNDFIDSCSKLRNDTDNWTRRIRKEFDDYMQKLELKRQELQKKYVKGGDVEAYVFIVASDDSRVTNGPTTLEWESITGDGFDRKSPRIHQGLVLPGHKDNYWEWESRIPVQIICKPESIYSSTNKCRSRVLLQMKPSDYQHLQDLAEEGKAFYARNKQLENKCLYEVQTELLDIYTPLKPTILAQ